MMRVRCIAARKRLDERQLGAVPEPLAVKNSCIPAGRDLDVLAERPERLLVDDHEVVAAHDRPSTLSLITALGVCCAIIMAHCFS